MNRLLAALLGAATLACGTLGSAAPARAADPCTIALIPGLTTDAFYITMRKGAEMAAKAVGCELLFQGAPGLQPGHPGAGAAGGDRAQAETRS